MRLRVGWRQMLRTIVAAVLADLVVAALHLPQGQWAVITCLVIVQGSVGNTLDASLSRVMGTLAGAVGGAFGLLLMGQAVLPPVVVLALALTPMAALVTIDARFRLAPVTAGIVLLSASGGAPGMEVVFDRVAEVLVGVMVGIGCTLLLVPERAGDALRRHAGTRWRRWGRLRGRMRPVRMRSCTSRGWRRRSRGRRPRRESWGGSRLWGWPAGRRRCC